MSRKSSLLLAALSPHLDCPVCLSSVLPPSALWLLCSRTPYPISPSSRPFFTHPFALTLSPTCVCDPAHFSAARVDVGRRHVQRRTEKKQRDRKEITDGNKASGTHAKQSKRTARKDKARGKGSENRKKKSKH